MKSKRFSASILAGHKECAVQVPFDPGAVWGLELLPFRPGRRGFAVRVVSRSARFESYVVKRSGKHWLLLDEQAMLALRAEVGDELTLTLTPALAPQ